MTNVLDSPGFNTCELVTLLIRKGKVLFNRGLNNNPRVMHGPKGEEKEGVARASHAYVFPLAPHSAPATQNAFKNAFYFGVWEQFQQTSQNVHFL